MESAIMSIRSRPEQLLEYLSTSWDMRETVIPSKLMMLLRLCSNMELTFKNSSCASPVPQMSAELLLLTSFKAFHIYQKWRMLRRPRGLFFMKEIWTPLITIPSVERSFSKLKLFKYYPRSTAPWEQYILSIENEISRTVYFQYK